MGPTGNKAKRLSSVHPYHKNNSSSSSSSSVQKKKQQQQKLKQIKNNYQSASLLPICRKIFEKVMSGSLY